MKTSIYALLLAGLVMTGAIAVPATSYPHPSSSADTTDVLIRIQKASAEEQRGHTPIEIEGPDGSPTIFWVGDTVMTVAPSDIDTITVLNRRGANSQTPRALVVHLNRDANRAFASVTKEAVGQHLAFRLVGDIVMVPRVIEPMLGGQVVLHGVPDHLRSRLAEKTQERRGK